MDAINAADWLMRGGLLAGVLLVLWAGSREIWVWGYLYRREKERADRFEQMALDLLQTAKAATEAAAKSRAGR